MKIVEAGCDQNKNSLIFHISDVSASEINQLILGMEARITELNKLIEYIRKEKFLNLEILEPKIKDNTINELEYSIVKSKQILEILKNE